jgi:hypothetical protein
MSKYSINQEYIVKKRVDAVSQTSAPMSLPVGGLFSSFPSRMSPASIINFLSNEDTGKQACFELAPGFFIDNYDIQFEHRGAFGVTPGTDTGNGMVSWL